MTILPLTLIPKVRYATVLLMFTLSSLSSVCFLLLCVVLGLTLICLCVEGKLNDKLPLRDENHENKLVDVFASFNASIIRQYLTDSYI